MKLHSPYQKMLLAICMVISLTGIAQQEFTLTTTAANITSAKALIDLPGLSGNTNAIIVATPIGNTKSLNPNPTGAWYYSGKWNIFNCNYGVMIPGLTYKVQYFLNPGPNQFMHLVTPQTLGSEGSYIDHPALNNKPNAQFTIFQNHSPEIRPGSWLNPHEPKTGYNASAGKWYIANLSGQPLQKGCAYNIVITSSGTGGPTVLTPIDAPPPTPCKCPASLPPNGLATGDLTGNYPDPMVRKIMGRPLSNTAPAIGQILKWNGTEWIPANETGAGGGATTYTPGLGINITGTEVSAMATTPMWNAFQLLGRDIIATPPAVGQVLKWGGGAWVPSDDNVGAGGAGPSYTAGTGIQVSGTQIAALNTTSLWNANKLSGRDIAATAPNTGQVLKWNGSVWAPANESAGTSTSSTMQTLFKEAGPANNATGQVPYEAVRPFPGLDHQLVLTKKSRLLISAVVTVSGVNCTLSCPGSQGNLVLDINGTRRYSMSVAATPMQHVSFTISNYVLELNPGNYNIVFGLENITTQFIRGYSNYSSIIVQPLE